MTLTKIAAALSRFFFGPPPERLIAEPKKDPLLGDPIKVRPAPAPNLTVVLEALTQAVGQFLQQHVRPVVALSPDTVYAIHTVRLLITPASLTLLKEFTRMPQPIRDKLAAACIEKATGAGALSLEDFYGWTVEGDAPVTEGQIIKVLASNEDDPLPLTFVFDGEYKTSPRPRSAPRPAVPGLQLDFQVLGGKEQQGRLDQFPALLGKGPACDLVLGGTFVSAAHVRLSLNESKSLMIEDISTNGTWLDGERIPNGQRLPLPERCTLSLGGPVDSDGIATLQLRRPALATPGSGETLTREPLPAAPLETPIKGQANHALPDEAARRPTPPVGETRYSQATAGAKETRMTGSPRGTALGRLRLRTAQGEERVIAIDALPFTIGREPTGPGLPLDDTLDLVSRQHLRLVKSQGHAGFLVDNPGCERNGTYRQGTAEGSRFVWDFAQDDEPGGWLTLGARGLNAGSVQLRLELANGSANGSRT